MSLKKVAMIPARLASTRFPEKLLQLLGDKSVIATVYEAVKKTALFDDVIVVTDSEAIHEDLKKFGATVVMSRGQHESGTDRIAEAAADMDVDVIVNVQGDTPFIQRDIDRGEHLGRHRFDRCGRADDPPDERRE